MQKYSTGTALNVPSIIHLAPTIDAVRFFGMAHIDLIKGSFPIGFLMWSLVDCCPPPTSLLLYLRGLLHRENAED